MTEDIPMHTAQTFVQGSVSTLIFEVDINTEAEARPQVLSIPISCAVQKEVARFLHTGRGHDSVVAKGVVFVEVKLFIVC